jgi:hypothetical protein
MDRYWINQMERQPEPIEINYKECAFCGWTLDDNYCCYNPKCSVNTRRKE